MRRKVASYRKHSSIEQSDRGLPLKELEPVSSMGSHHFRPFFYDQTSPNYTYTFAYEAAAPKIPRKFPRRGYRPHRTSQRGTV